MGAAPAAAPSERARAGWVSLWEVLGRAVPAAVMCAGALAGADAAGYGREHEEEAEKP